MADIKKIKFYISKIEEMHQQGELDPEKILQVLFVISFDIAVNYSSIVFFKADIEKFDATLTDKIIDLDNAACKDVEYDKNGSLHAILSAFFFFYPMLFDVYSKKMKDVDIENPLSNKLPESIFRDCWKVAQLLRQKESILNCQVLLSVVNNAFVDAESFRCLTLFPEVIFKAYSELRLNESLYELNINLLINFIQANEKKVVISNLTFRTGCKVLVNELMRLNNLKIFPGLQRKIVDLLIYVAREGNAYHGMINRELRIIICNALSKFETDDVVLVQSITQAIILVCHRESFLAIINFLDAALLQKLKDQNDFHADYLSYVSNKITTPIEAVDLKIKPINAESRAKLLEALIKKLNSAANYKEYITAVNFLQKLNAINPDLHKSINAKLIDIFKAILKNTSKNVIEHIREAKPYKEICLFLAGQVFTQQDQLIEILVLLKDYISNKNDFCMRNTKLIASFSFLEELKTNDDICEDFIFNMLIDFVSPENKFNKIYQGACKVLVKRTATNIELQKKLVARLFQQNEYVFLSSISTQDVDLNKSIYEKLIEVISTPDELLKEPVGDIRSSFYDKIIQDKLVFYSVKLILSQMIAKTRLSKGESVPPHVMVVILANFEFINKLSVYLTQFEKVNMNSFVRQALNGDDLNTPLRLNLIGLQMNLQRSMEVHMVLLDKKLPADICTNIMRFTAS